MSHGLAPTIERIVLVGLMASGKTTVGRRLAERLGWEFVDLDERIELRTGHPPARIIRERGEPAFRAIEDELTGELARRRSLVLAPGGGWVTNPAAERLGPGTVRVWLRIPVEEAIRRAAGSPGGRPLLDDAPDRLERARGLLRDREPLYARSEVVVDVAGKDPETVVREIARRLESESGGR